MSKSTTAFVEDLVSEIRDIYQSDSFIPLHAPKFDATERMYVLETLETGFVSSVGEHVSRFEASVAKYTGIKHCIATVNGTSALQVALIVAGVKRGDEVLTQAISFVAGCNAITYCGASPVLIDVEKETLGMCPSSLEQWLWENAEMRDDGRCWNKNTNHVVSACMPMHDLGHPVRIQPIAEICRKWNLKLVEDAAESLGSWDGEQHTGASGTIAAISFNGNKIITTGGGGMVLTNDDELATKARHLSTTAKTPHPWLYIHDEIGFNYRLPAINAALGCAQMAKLEGYVANKRALAERYNDWFSTKDYDFFNERKGTKANYWFNAFFVKSVEERDAILEATNTLGVMTRPLWTPMHYLEMYKNCQAAPLDNSEYLEATLVNIPSSVTT